MKHNLMNRIGQCGRAIFRRGIQLGFLLTFSLLFTIPVLKQLTTADILGERFSALVRQVSAKPTSQTSAYVGYPCRYTGVSSENFAAYNLGISLGPRISIQQVTCGHLGHLTRDECLGS
jgi:hypothetical protein